jgi:hypothetical protein
MKRPTGTLTSEIRARWLDGHVRINKDAKRNRKRGGQVLEKDDDGGSVIACAMFSYP